MSVTSPCTGICKLDEATGWCLGCGRSGDEIADWRSHGDAWRADIWGLIPQRLGQLGIACRRLPWTTAEIRAFAADTMRDARGTWVMGVVGAVAEFTAMPGAAVDVRMQGDDLIARTRNGALRMRIDDGVRALTFDPPGQPGHARVVIAVKRERGRLPVADGVADLGEDSEALLPDPGTRLFDLGLARKEARFCVRVGEGASKDALEAVADRPFAESLQRIGAPLLSESPTRVVQTALGRVEVQGRIPPPDGQSQEGPHTHLLPDHLASGCAQPVGMELPRVYLPGAIFYPKR
ncbi:MAG: DUF1289 domain-containing protein [Pseudomonadota bacterium]